MTAYVISDGVGLDPELVSQYRALARDSIAHHDGHYLTNVGSTIDPVEGGVACRDVDCCGPVGADSRHETTT